MAIEKVRDFVTDPAQPRPGQAREPQAGELDLACTTDLPSNGCTEGRDYPNARVFGRLPADAKSRGRGRKWFC